MVEWNTETLLEHFSLLVESLKDNIEERDRRYDEKFAAKTELARATEGAAERAIASFKTNQDSFLKERDSRYETRFKAQEDSVISALFAADRNTDLARVAMEKRLDGMNEFRDAMQDQANNYLTRNEYGVQHKALEDTLEAHIVNETARVQAQEERLDGRLKGMKADVEKKADQKEMDNIKSKADTNSKWLFGMIAGLFVSIILTVIDLATRFIGG